MDAPIATSSSSVRKALDEACARNTPARLEYCGPEGSVHTAKVRLIKLDGNEIYTDAPSFDSSQERLSKHQQVEVHTLVSGSRCAFCSRVKRVLTTVALNSHRSIRAITLSIPERIVPRQRRKCYRVSLAGHSDIEARICPTLRGRADCCAVDAQWFRGRLLNLSAEGALVIVPASQRTRFECGDGFFMEFRLPADEEPFYLSAEARHFRRVHEETDTLIGLRFRTDAIPELRPVLRRVTSFIATEQRRQLRRERRR